MREPVTPRGRYEAVGKEGRLAAIVSGALAVLVMIGVIVGIFFFLITASDPPDEPAKPAARPAEPVRSSGSETPQGVATTTDCPDCPALVTIPPGTFVMGIRGEEVNDDHIPQMQQQAEQPMHGVTVRDPIAMGQTEVTRGQFAVFVAETGHQSLGCMVNNGKTWVLDRSKSWREPGFSQDDEHPAVCVNYDDAKAYTDWLSRKTGKRYRLPTETEWEYAARAGTHTRYHSGDEPASLLTVANVFDADSAANWARWKEMALTGHDGHAFTAPVGSFAPNAWGLFDMHGNAWEWVSDWYGEDAYAKSANVDPQGPATGNVRVRRGGSWHTWPFYARASYRNYNASSSRYTLLGFRVVREWDSDDKP